ncbi:MAG: hypothetical protein ACTHLE_14215 [Agriterribacter sp.]
MKHYEKYLILPTDLFDPANFSFVAEELRIINEKTESVSSVFKSDIIISFLKYHSLKRHWIDQNPQLTKMMTSGILLAVGTEALFASCINNPVFRQDLENYVNELIPFEEEAEIQS